MVQPGTDRFAVADSEDGLTAPGYMVTERYRLSTPLRNFPAGPKRRMTRLRWSNRGYRPCTARGLPRSGGLEW
jgi:hypothetical protein